MSKAQRSVGARVRAIREAMGVTQDELARLSDIAAPNLSRFENGRADIQVGTLLRILEALDLIIEFEPGNAPMPLADALVQSERGRERLASAGLAPSDPGARLEVKRSSGVDVSLEQSLVASNA